MGKDYKTPPLPPITTRSVTAEDCAAVSDIIAFFAQQAILLWRTPEDVAKHRENFLLAECAGEVIGCVAIQDYGNGLVELRSLAVRQGYQGRGIGTILIKAALELAAERGAKRVFALTKRATLFVRNGFDVTDRSDFPQKVWNDCSLCPKQAHCIEIAVVYKLT